MPTRDNPPLGAPCWVDLVTSDPEGARTFYGQLFGWESDEPNPEFGGYFTFTLDGARVAGGMPKQPEHGGIPDVWSVYLAVENAEKTVEVATSNGAQVIAPAMAVADLGSMAVIADPTGAAIGMWQPGSHTGFGVITEPGAPSWFELHTRDYDTAVAFYRDTFGWETRTMGDSPEFRYTVQQDPTADDQYAGIMDASAFLPEGLPAHWDVYFGAADADAALAKVVELGGRVVTPAEDTPYGRLATAADPTGAVFRIVAANEQMPAK